MSNNIIGTRKESSLHRSLKFQYSGKENLVETPAGSYVCDACTDDGEYIEVQTGSFGPLKEKAKEITKKNKLRIIHPIINQKHIELYDEKGRLKHRRKSPLKGNPWDLFKVLVYAPSLPLLKNLVIELAVIEVTEKRIDDGTGSWRRKGVRIADRSLALRRDTIILEKPKDYKQFLPFTKKEQFTVRDLAEKAGINPDIARQALYVLTKMGIVKRVGKKVNAIVYSL